MQAQIITASLYICRTAQIIRRAYTVAAFFFPVVIAATRLVPAYIVLAGLFAYDLGVNCRNYLENNLGVAIAQFLNEFCYLVNPQLAPAAQPIQYFIEEKERLVSSSPSIQSSADSDSILSDPWEQDVEIIVCPVSANNIKSLLLLPPAKNTIADLSIRELKKRASAAKIRNYNVMTKMQLVEALTA